MHSLAYPAVLLSLFLAGCATADTINFANGQPGYAIKCDLGLNGLDQCYRKAGNICADRGYALRDWKGTPITFAAMQEQVDQDFSGFSAKRILIQCNT